MIIDICSKVFNAMFLTILQFFVFKLIFVILLASRETSPHRVCSTSRHITSSLETSPTSSRTASPLPQDTDGEEEEFIDTVEV